MSGLYVPDRYRLATNTLFTCVAYVVPVHDV